MTKNFNEFCRLEYTVLCIPSLTVTDDYTGEKAGGGVGGVVFLLLIGGLIYFCCCRGGKHKYGVIAFIGTVQYLEFSVCSWYCTVF